jgi:tetratricopeptide (TPR) repeat protein/predicted Ser/Thr protein kinase
MNGRTVGHYEVLEKIGEGGMGSVYKARDRRLERLVALKVITPDHSQDENRRRRFIQEARAASALNHPNIVTIYEIAEWEGADFIAMEYIEGHTLRFLLDGPPELAVTLKVVRQLAEALAAAHAAHIVHRDVKPDNAMLRADGYVKLLDFGLARLAKVVEGSDDPTAAPTGPGVVLGTRRYMSPEQAEGETVEGASDVFSLGIVLFELTTGVHPFVSSSTGGTVKAILLETPARPARLNPEIPTALEDLILRMLSKEPLLRPTAADVHAEIALMARGDDATGRILPSSRAVRRQSVGHDAELRALHTAFDVAPTTGWSLLGVTGEPGLGKTTVVEDFLEALRARRGTAWIARGRCSERLSGVDALLPVLEGLESLIRGESGDHAARLLKRLAPSWYLQVAPSLGTSTQEVMTREAATASPERMKRELHAFVQELSRVRPLVLFFDDMHWADLSTCDLVAHLGARCREDPVLLVTTWRPSDLQAGKHPFQQVVLQHQARGAFKELPLQFLTRDDVGRMLALQFPDHHFPGELASVIHAKTEGNPLFVSDILRYLRDRGALVQQGGVWVMTEGLSEIEKEVPATIRSMIELKIERLGESDRPLLLAAAVQGVQFDTAVIARALAKDPADVEERLQDIERRTGLVRSVGEQEFPDRTLSVRYRFVHVFYQNALFGGLTPSRRASMSATVAGALVALGAEKVRALAGDLAFLFESARDFPRAAPLFLTAARYAARVFAYPETALLAERGLRALAAIPESPERDKLELPLTLTLAIALMATRGYAAPEVLRAQLRARELCLKFGDNRRLFPVLWGLWSSYLIGSKLEEARQVAEQMQPAVDSSTDVTVQVEALHAMGTTLAYLGRLRESRQYLDRIFERYDPAVQPFHASIYVLDPGVSALAVLARTLVLLGETDEALRLVEDAVERARRLGHPQSLAYAIFFLSWVHHDRGDVAAARDAVTSAIGMSLEHGLFQIVEWGRVMRGWTLCEEGRPEEGVRDLRHAAGGLLAMHANLERPYCLALLGRGLSQLGKHDEALAAIDEGLSTMEHTGERCYEPEIRRLRAEALIAQAIDPREARTSDSQPGVGAPRALRDREQVGTPGFTPGVPDDTEAAALLAAAEAELEKALVVGHQSGALTLSLRAAMSLLRLHNIQLRDGTQARTTLAGLFEQLTQGRETRHAQEARALLAAP